MPQGRRKTLRPEVPETGAVSKETGARGWKYLKIESVQFSDFAFDSFIS